MAEENSKMNNILSRLSRRINDGVAKALENEGRFVARNPASTIVMCLIITLTGSALLYFNWEKENDGYRLYTPRNSVAFNDREYVEAVYGFPPVQDRVMVMAAGGYSKNLLVSPETAKSNLLELMDLYEMMHEFQVDFKEEKLKYRDVCFRPVPGAPCKEESILDVWDNNRSLLEADTNVLDSINSNATTVYGLPINMELVLGGIERDDEGRIKVAEVFLIALDVAYVLRKVGDETTDPRAKAWDLDLVDVVKSRWQSNRMDGFLSNIVAIDRESDKAVMKDVKILLASYGLIGIYIHIALFRNNRIRIKSHLAIWSLLSVIFSLLTSFGVAILFTPFNPIIQVLPFLLLGLGVDDTFVIVGAFSRTDPKSSAEERIGIAMKCAGSSVFVTTLTDFVAFLVGIYTQLPALQSFCAFAAAGILFDFIFQVTFFLAFLALEARREERAINHASSSQSNEIARSFQEDSFTIQTNPLHDDSAKDLTHTSKQTHPPLEALDFKAHQSPNKKEQDRATDPVDQRKKKIVGKGLFDESQPSLTARLIGEWLPKISLSPAGRTGVLLMEGLLIGFAIYGCLNVHMDFRYREWFTPDGSWLKDAFDVESRYFFGNQMPFSVFTKEPVDGGSYFDHLDELQALGPALRAEKHVSAVPRIKTWYESFVEWLPSSRHRAELENGLPPNSTAFVDWTREFVMSEDGRAYFGSVIFSRDRKHIVSSKIDGFSKDIANGEFAVAMVDGLRGVARNSAPSLHAISYHYTFLFYDGFRVITRETILNVAMAGVAVFLVTTILLADLTAAICVGLMVALTDIGLFGFMWYVGLTFNTVTSVDLVLAVGVAVDYSAHIAHSFTMQTGSRKERARLALKEIGGDVFSGAFTTWLAVVLMGLATHYIFRTFFKMFFCITVTGVWHGLVVLPVVLSLIGPNKP